MIPKYRLPVLIVGIAVYSDVALLFSDDLTAAGTVAYIFTMLAFLLNLYICFRCGQLGVVDQPPLSRLLHRSIPELGWIYWLAQLCLGVIFPFLTPNASFLLALALCGGLCAVAVVVLRPET